MPLYVTENDIATEDDNERIECLHAHLAVLAQARPERVDVRDTCTASRSTTLSGAKDADPSSAPSLSTTPTTSPAFPNPAPVPLPRSLTMESYRKDLRMTQIRIAKEDALPEIALPEGFILGTATSAYQIEGAWNVGGKGPSIWDTYTSQPGKTAGSVSGRDGVDHYHRFAEDIATCRPSAWTATASR